MTYDALLSLRGWGEAEFRRASPDFLAAARFALFAERLAPEYLESMRTLAIDVPIDAQPSRKTELLRAKVAARAQLDHLEAELFPE